MENPCIQHTKADHLVDDGNEIINEFISNLLEAFKEPDNLLAWERVQDCLQALGHVSESELRERRDLIHYLNRFFNSLNSEKIPIKSKLLPNLRHLLDTLSITKEYVRPQTEETEKKEVRNNAKRLPSHHSTSSDYGSYHLDDIFTFDPSSLPPFTPHPPPVSISDLRSSIPTVLSEVVKLNRGRKVGLGITEQSLDLSLSTTLPLNLNKPTQEKCISSVTPPRAQLLPLPQGLKKKDVTKQQTSSPKTGDAVMKYFIHGGENRFFYLKSDPTSLQYEPYQLVVHNDGQYLNTPNSEMYIMSAFGIIRNFSDGYTESSSLVTWQREATLFRALRIIPFFRMFPLLKVLRKWKKVADRRRHDRVREYLLGHLILQIPCFLPLLYSTSQWDRPLQELQLLPETPAELASIQTVEHLLLEEKQRVLSEVTQMYVQTKQQVEQLWVEQKQELSYCLQKISLEDNRTVASKALPLSTQSRALKMLIQQREQVLTAVKLIPNLTKLLSIRLHLALRGYAIVSADSYLNYLNIGYKEEEAIPAISLEIGAFNEGKRIVMECQSKWSDTYDLLLSPFNEHYIDLERLDVPILTDSITEEINKALKNGKEDDKLRGTKLSFVRHVVAHSLMTDCQSRPPTEGEVKRSHLYKSYEGFMLGKKIHSRLREKLQEATKHHERRLLEVLRETNREISVRLEFLKWMEELVLFIQVWGIPQHTSVKMTYFKLVDKIEKLEIWRDRLDNVPEVWITENRLFQLDLSAMKSTLSSRLVVAATNLFEICFNQYRDCYNEFMEVIKKSIHTINESNLSVDNFTQHTQQFDKLKADKNIVQKLKKELDEMYELLQQSPVAHVEDLEEKHVVIMPTWYKYISYLQSTDSFINGQKGQVIQNLMMEFSKLGERAQELVKAAGGEQLTKWTEQPQVIRDTIHEIDREFLKIKENMKTCEDQLKQLVTEEEATHLRQQLDQVIISQEKITVMKNLWDSVTISVETISNWKQMPFAEMKKWKEQLEEKKVQHLADEEVVKIWKNILDKFSSFLPSLELLVDPGMKTQFWQVLFTALGCVFPSTGVVPTINSLISRDILNHKVLIKHIHASAMVEGRLEEILHKVILTWKFKEYKLVKQKAVPFQGVGEKQENGNLMYLSQQQGFTSFVLQDPEEFLSLINDNSSRLHLVVQSNCSQGLKKRAQLWIDKLQQLADLLTIWMDCQAKWIYISSVYVEFAVLGTHPGEVEIFKQLNASYQSLINTLFENKKMLHLIGVRVETNLQLLDETNYLTGRLLTHQKELTEMMKPLEGMAEEARRIFPRAFFLSQEQVLYLYIHTGNPRALLSQLRLCFPGVHNVNWDTENPADKLSTLGDLKRLGFRIKHVKDMEGDNLELINPLVTGHQPGHLWLKGLENALQISISYKIHRVLHCINLLNLFKPNYNPFTDLFSYLKDNSQQCVAMALSVVWTYMIDKSIEEENNILLSLLANKLSQSAATLINGISSPIEEKKRSAASSLILRIHNLQHSLSILQKEHSLSHQNFLWVSQFKYNLSDTEIEQLIPIITISHLNYNYPYCNEYQGCGCVLVSTPLTDKCMFNLSLAMYTNKLAGVIGHHSGTISETVRNLCYITGRACFSLNASTFQTHAQVTNVLLGFIQSGTVGYIANLDTLKPNLSCTLVSLLKAVKKQIENSLPYKSFLYFYEVPQILGKSIDWYSMKEFGILGELSIGGKVPLKHGYGCCVSMRSDNLPEEFSNYLHTQIHFFYFSTPNYAPILEALFLSYNFASYKILSCKVTSFLQHLGSFFGKDFIAQATELRHILIEAFSYLVLVGEVLGVEGSLEERETLAVYCAIWKFVKPQLATSEIILAKNVLNSILPESSHSVGILSQLDFSNMETVELEKTLTRILVERHYRPNTKEVEKIFDIHNSLKRGQNILLFGPTLCGKTTCLQLLANALNELTDKYRRHVDMTTIYPHALDSASLYGWYDRDSLRWRQGFLHKLFSNKLFACKLESTEREQWFIFDGRLNGDWISQLQTMLYPPKQFTTCDTTTIQLPITCKCIFETDSLCDVAPNLLSNCYPIVIEEGVLSWRDHLDQWLKSITVSQGIAMCDVIDLKHYTDKTVAAVIEYVRKDLLGASKNFIEMLYVRSFTNIMSAMFRKFYLLSFKYQTSPLVFSSNIEEESQKVLGFIFLFSLAWGFGGSMDSKRKIAFSEFLRNLFSQNGLTSGLESKLDKNVFNYFIEPTRRLLVSWNDRSTDYTSTSSYVRLSEIDKQSVIGDLLLNHGIPIFYSGPIGCGKTSMVENLLTHRVKLNSLSYSPLWTPSRLQQRIRTMHLAHQKTHIAFSPIDERCTLFIDDFNLPNIQAGCQDVLRQVLDSSMVYDASTNVMKPIYIQLVVCSNLMDPFSNPKHARLYSHFFNLRMDEPDSDTLYQIFYPPVTKWLSGHFLLSQEAGRAKMITQTLVKSSIVMFECIKEKLKPTPASPQYSFSLFELNRLFQSLFLFTPKIDSDKEIEKLDSKPNKDLLRNNMLSLIPKRKRNKTLTRYETIDNDKGRNIARVSEENFVTLEKNLLRIWCHEHCRVYGDKIIDEKDQEWFQTLLKNCLQRTFCSSGDMRSASEELQQPKRISKLSRSVTKKQIPIEENEILARHTKEMSKENFWKVKIPLNRIFTVIEEMTSLMYFRKLQINAPGIPSFPQQRDTPRSKYIYTEVTEVDLKYLLQPHLDTLNENFSAENKIIIYPFALEHIARLSRVLQLVDGHAMFCAQRRTGRKTIAKLAIALTESQLYEMEASEDRNTFEDCLPILQAAINSSVVSRKHSVVLVSGDWCPKVWHAIGELLALEICNKERMSKDLEDDSRFLSQFRVSPIPEIFKTDITPPHYSPRLTSNLLKHNLHFVLIIDNTATSFTKFLTDYHKLLRFLTIDILAPLCELSLREVAHTWLSNNTVNRWVDAEVSLDKVSEIASHIHCSAFERAKKIYPEDDLWIYKSNIRIFIDFLKTTRKMAHVISSKEDAITLEVKKAQGNLTTARLESKNMQINKKLLQEKKSEKIDEMKAFEVEMDNIHSQYINAEKDNELLAEKVEKCNEIIQMVSNNLKSKFGDVDPLYKRAGEALGALCKEDIVELSTFQQPPDGVKKIAECLCVLFKREVNWNSALELFKSKHFYQNLLYYDKEENMSTILSSQQIKSLCNSPEVDKITFSSKAAASVARWLIALYQYAKVDEETRDKRRVLSELKREVERLEIQRGKERIRINICKTEFQSDKNLLETKKSEIIEFDKKIQVYENSIKDAERIFSSIQLVEAKFNKIIMDSHNRVASIGNVLITAGAIIYLTPFPTNVISELVESWKQTCGVMTLNSEVVPSATVKVTTDFSLHEILTTEEERFYWETKKKELPQGEEYKIKLVLIRAVASFDTVWPYVYDPTGLFYKWMKTIESTFRGEEIEHLFELTRGFEKLINTSIRSPITRTGEQKSSNVRRSSYIPPNEPQPATASISSISPSESFEKEIRLKRSWSQIQRSSIIRAIFSTNIHLVRCYDEDFETVVETELFRVSPVPIIVLSMSCLPPETSRTVIYSEFEEREGRRYYKGREGKYIVVPTEFRMYLTSNYNPVVRGANMSNFDLNKIRFCCFEPARESLRDILFMVLSEVEMGEVQNKLATATRDVIHFYKLMKEKRKTLLRHIIDSPSIANDLELIKLISRTGQELYKAEEGRAECQKSCDKLQEQLDMLRVVSDNVEIVWFALDRFQYLCKREYCFTLVGFIDTFQTIANKTAADTFRPNYGAVNGGIHYLGQIILRQMCSFYLSQLIESDKPYFLLTFILSTQLSEGYFSQIEWNAFFFTSFSIPNCIEVLNSIFSDLASNSPPFIRPEEWGRISQLNLSENFASVIDTLSSQPIEWKEYFGSTLHTLVDRLPSGKTLKPETRLLLWKETQPRYFLAVLREFFIHRIGTTLDGLRLLSLWDSFALATPLRPVILHSDSKQCVGDCLEIVRFGLMSRNEEFRVFDLACKSSLDSLQVALGLESNENKEWIIIVNCENVDRLPQPIITFLNVSFLCRFGDETKNKSKRLLVITHSSALHRLPLSLRSSSLKLAYNYKYFTLGERLELYTNVLRNHFDINLDSCSVLMKINASNNSRIKYEINKDTYNLTGQISFLHSIVSFLQEFFSCSRYVAECDHFLSSIFSGSCSLQTSWPDKETGTHDINRILPGTWTRGVLSCVSLLAVEMMTCEVSLELVGQMSDKRGKINERELELEPLLEMLDILIADIITLLNIVYSLFKSLLLSFHTGAHQTVYKQELTIIKQKLEKYLKLLKITREHPYHPHHPSNLQHILMLSGGYMPDIHSLTTICSTLVWYKEALEYFKSLIEGPRPLVLRYHHRPQAWLSASMCEHAKTAGNRMERCIPVAKILKGSQEEAGLIEVLQNVSLDGVLWCQQSQDFTISPSQSLSNQKLAILCVSVEEDDARHQLAPLYSLEVSFKPIFSCQVYIPIRDGVSSNKSVTLVQLH